MRLAVVVPRYGAEIAGGAERLARGIAQEAARRGATVEVWTTCARDHYTWANALPAGAARDGAIVVLRFPVEHRHIGRQLVVEHRMATGARLPAADQYDWLEGGAQSPALYAHIARHAAAWDAVLVMPYAMPMMHQAAWAAPDRIVFWPCLHDEPYAYLEPLRLLMENARAVAFNAPEEADLARRLGMRLRHQTVLGVGVEMAEPPATPASTERGLLYIGRLEEGKNLPQLYRFVRRYADEGGSIALTVVGRGPLEPPAHPAFRFRGFVTEAEKGQLCAGALALCQPSLNESFSITLMEGWLAGRPALVHRDCAVTRGHVQRSKGGLWFSTYETFVGAVAWLQANSDLAARMGANGRQYVGANYTWRAVVDRLERFVASLQPTPQPGALEAVV